MKKHSFLLGILWVFSLGLIILQISIPIIDTDFWWHLAHGREMFQSRTFLNFDVFSHTRFGSTWINFEWLSQMVFYVIYQVAGFPFVLGFKIFLCLIALGLVGLSARKCGANGSWLLVSVWMAHMLLLPRFRTRPELFSLGFMALYIFISMGLADFDKKWQKRQPWILFVISVIWINLHGGLIYGIAILLLFTLGSYWVKEKKNLKKARRWSFLASLGALLVNPFGPKIIHMFVEASYFISQDKSAIVEWKPPTFLDLPTYWVALVVTFVVLLVRLRWDWKKVRFWVPIVIVFSLLSLQYFRSTVLLAFVAVPFLMNSLKPFWKKKYSSLVGVGLVVFFISTNASSVKLVEVIRPVNWSRTVQGAAQFVQTHNIKGNLYNSYSIGGFLAWSLAPERKIFMDGRYLFHDFVLQERQLIRDMTNNPSSDPWQAYLNSWDIEVAIVEASNTTFRLNRKEGPASLNIYNFMFPRQFWGLVYWDDVSYVFLKRGGQNDSLISQMEYKTVRPYSLDLHVFLLDRGFIQFKDVNTELERHFTEMGPTRIGSVLWSITN